MHVAGTWHARSQIAAGQAEKPKAAFFTADAQPWPPHWDTGEFAQCHVGIRTKAFGF